MTRLFLIATALLMVTGCGRVAPDAGFEHVLIKKPYFFGTGGIDPTPVSTSTYIALSTDDIPVDVRPFQKAESVQDMVSADGVPLDFEAKIRLRVTDSVRLIRDFGTDWYRVNLQPQFLRFVRDAVGARGTNDMVIGSKGSEAVDREVTDKIKAYIAEKKLPAELLDVTLGRANPPDAILNQRVETSAQEQRVNTERNRKLAEDERAKAELSRANADNAYRQQMQLSPEQFLQLEQIKQFSTVCGGGKCTILMGGGGGVVPTLSVK